MPTESSNGNVRGKRAKGHLFLSHQRLAKTDDRVVERSIEEEWRAADTACIGRGHDCRIPMDKAVSYRLVIRGPIPVEGGKPEHLVQP